MDNKWALLHIRNGNGVLMLQKGSMYFNQGKGQGLIGYLTDLCPLVLLDLVLEVLQRRKTLLQWILLCLGILLLSVASTASLLKCTTEGYGLFDLWLPFVNSLLECIWGRNEFLVVLKCVTFMVCRVVMWNLCYHAMMLILAKICNLTLSRPAP